MGETLKILVTGSSGYLGSYLVRYFKDQHEVHGLDIRPSSEEIVFHKIDIRKSFKLGSYDVIIHCASLVPISSASYEEYFSTNVIGTKNVLRIKTDQFIYISTSAVYDGGYITEDTPLRPVGSYGLTKFLAEKIIGSRGVIVRPRTILGGIRLGFLDYILSNIKNDRPIFLLKGSKDKIIQFVHIKDLKSFVELLIKKFIDKGSYNVGTSEYNTLGYDLTKSIKLAGSRSRIIFFPNILNNILRGLNLIKIIPYDEWHEVSLLNDFYFDIRKARDLGWRPVYSNIDMLVETIQNYNISYEGSLHRSSLNYLFLKILRKGGII